MCVGVSVVSVMQASACNTDTTPTQSHRNSNTHRTKNNMTNVVIQQNSRMLLMIDILISETCWAYKKWNKIASDIKLVFYSETIDRHIRFQAVQNDLNTAVQDSKFVRCWSTTCNLSVYDSCLVDGLQSFGPTYYLHLQGNRAKQFTRSIVVTCWTAQ